MSKYKIILLWVNNGKTHEFPSFPTEQDLTPEQAQEGYVFDELIFSAFSSKAPHQNLTVQSVVQGKGGKPGTVFVTRKSTLR